MTMNDYAAIKTMLAEKHSADSRPTVDQIDHLIALAEADRTDLLLIQREIIDSGPPKSNRRDYFTDRANLEIRSDLMFLVQGFRKPWVSRTLV